MKMTVSQTARVARNVLNLIKANGLNDLDSVKKMVGHSFESIAGCEFLGEEYFEISIQPSNRGTQAVVLNYFRTPGHRHLEIRINEELRHSVIILACEKKLGGYDHFDKNKEGDYIQDKKLMTKDFSEVIKELERLEKLT